MPSRRQRFDTRKRALRRRLRHRTALARAAVLRRPGPAHQVVVIGEGRTGSSLLIDYLDSLPDASVIGEVLSPIFFYGLRGRYVSRAAALRHLRLCLRAPDVQLSGVKLHFGQLEGRGISFEELGDALPSARFLVLYRRSLAEQYVSRQIAAATAQWSVRREAKRIQASVRVDRAELLRYCERMRRRYEAVLRTSWIRDRGMLVTYEELAADPQTLFRGEILPFLGVSPATVKTRFVKQDPRPLRARVENFDELRDLLCGEATQQHHAL